MKNSNATIRTALTLLGSLGLMVSPQMSLAQQSHGIAAVINDDIVTNRDLTQRVLFMMATTGADRNEDTLKRIQRQANLNKVLAMKRSTARLRAYFRAMGWNPKMLSHVLPKPVYLSKLSGIRCALKSRGNVL